MGDKISVIPLDMILNDFKACPEDYVTVEKMYPNGVPINEDTFFNLVNAGVNVSYVLRHIMNARNARNIYLESSIAILRTVATLMVESGLNIPKFNDIYLGKMEALNIHSLYRLTTEYHYGTVAETVNAAIGNRLIAEMSDFTHSEFRAVYETDRIVRLMAVASLMAIVTRFAKSLEDAYILDKKLDIITYNEIECLMATSQGYAFHGEITELVRRLGVVVVSNLNDRFERAEMSDGE